MKGMKGMEHAELTEQILSCLVEGNYIRATCRMTGAAKNTVVKLLVDAGRACSEYQDKAFRNLSCKRIQCDEIWSFVGSKEKTTSSRKKAEGNGDVWTWTALDPDLKLIPCWFVGSRDAGSAYHFMHDLADRLASRVQLSTDGHRPYLSAVEDAFGTEIDYAMLVKIYGNEKQAETRYSPAVCMGARKAVISGKPEVKHISTSLTERNNLTMRMSMRRFTRLINAFSKKLENYEHAIALHFMHYNFCRIHQTIRVTPAMEAGVSERVCKIPDIVDLLES